MPCTVPKISAHVGAGKQAAAHTASAKAIPRHLQKDLELMFILTRVDTQTTSR